MKRGRCAIAPWRKAALMVVQGRALVRSLVRPLVRPLLRSLALVLAAGAASVHAAPDFSGQVRPEWVQQRVSPRDPLVRADAVQPGLYDLPASGPAVETELRGSGYGMTGIATVRQQRAEGGPFHDTAWVNELYAAHGLGNWQFSAGKRIVGWDVGYGFRPNDIVEQEVRRTLLTVTPEGRPLAMVEHYDASTAWSFVLVNPGKPRAQRYAQEPALAMRVYQRDGAVDWHGFAREGIRTGASLGAAVAWVASDSVELHGSVRWMRQADSVNTAGATGALLQANPWHDASAAHPVQALVGGTWTNAEQVSVLAEAWWDGTALSSGQWRDWTARNAQLAARVAGPAPALAVAGNLAWQGNAFNPSMNVQRMNLFVRASLTQEKWQPAFDLLFTPADAGRIVTVSTGWQGDRVRFDGGLRVYGGPSSAVLAQVPTRRVVYVAGTWSF